MHIHQLQLTNFRCFSQKTVSIDRSVTLIQGLNGAGKTSLLEALHYLCYLRSFRTHSPRELVRAGNTSFFIKAAITSDTTYSVVPSTHTHEVQVGFSGSKRLVKINQKGISSYKELIDFYRIVTLTADDVSLITQGPQMRRSFLDQALLLYNPEIAPLLRTVRHVADQRNRLLYHGYHEDVYTILTEQLWKASRQVQCMRMALLKRFEQEIIAIQKTYFDECINIRLTYKSKLVDTHNDSFSAFLDAHPTLYMDERRYGRSLFGAHVDDFSIVFDQKQAKTFASRGQQKLVVVLLKIAHMRELLAVRGSSIFLLDDFITDFDEQRLATLLRVLIDLRTQLIFTAPSRSNLLEQALASLDAQIVLLTH